MNQTKPSRKAPLKVLNRVLRYMLHYYALPFALVIVCILITAVATVTGATFPQKLVDDYIVPMLNSGSTDFPAWLPASSSWPPSWRWASSRPSATTASWSR